MNLNPIKSNMTEVCTDKVSILFSYKTPVAYIDNSTGKAYKTDKFWSRTTSKHINYWLDGQTAEPIDQGTLDRLIIEVA